mgnify:FL=1
MTPRRTLLRGLVCLTSTGWPLVARGTDPERPPSPRGTSAPTSTAGHPPDSALPDLPKLTREAFASRRPLVLMFSLRGCPWCDSLRREHFAGLQKRQAAEGILALELDMTDARRFESVSQHSAPDTGGWRGGASPRDIARALRVRLAPTLLFLGPDSELAERLVGYASPDFFGAYLEQRIEQARLRMRTAS